MSDNNNDWSEPFQISDEDIIQMAETILWAADFETRAMLSIRQPYDPDTCEYVELKLSTEHFREWLALGGKITEVADSIRFKSTAHSGGSGGSAN